jgi:hypothetical protein
MISRILLGCAVILLGILMVYKTPWFLSMLGRIYWAEKNLGMGGTRIFIKLMGVGVSVIGIIILTNLHERLIGGFLIRIFG